MGPAGTAADGRRRLGPAAAPGAEAGDVSPPAWDRALPGVLRRSCRLSQGVFRRRKRIVEVSDAFRRLRACYPRKRLFVIMDNLHNVHDHPRFLRLLHRLRIHPVPTPTEASWLNLIEAHLERGGFRHPYGLGDLDAGPGPRML